MSVNDNKQSEQDLQSSSKLKSCKLKLGLLAVAFCLGTSVLIGCASLTAAPPRPEVSTLGTISATVVYASGEEVQMEMVWSKGSDCGTCHETQVESTSNECLAASHADESCIDCHDQASVLKKTHGDLVGALKAEPPEELKDTQITNEFCISCHDMGAVIPLTEAVLVDEEGSSFNPHNIPINDQHQTITCGSCHMMHMEADTVATANETCSDSDCHHDGIYVSCASCHEDY